MERLLRLVEGRTNSDCARQDEGIFDIQTYQKAIDRMSCSSSLEQAVNGRRRLSLSETANFPHPRPPLKDDARLRLKDEIRPHQARHIVSRITEIIKTKKEASKFLSEQANHRIHEGSPDKKSSSYSAYIHARKKIFERQNPAVSERSEPTSNNLILEDQGDLFCGDYARKPTKWENEGQEYLNNTVSKYQRIRLEGIVTKKKIEAKQTREDKPAQLDPARTARLARSFITVIKRRPNHSQLMVNPTTHPASQRNIEHLTLPTHDYAKNFVGQTRLHEEEIEIFPESRQQVKLGRATLGAEQAGEVGARAASVLHCVGGEVRSLLAWNQKDKAEIASVTKVMTCLLVLTIADKFCLDLKHEKLIVSERASRMQGTSARLAYSDVLTIWEALHGLMLPSGNDAAVALGEWGGKQVRKYSGLLRRLRAGEDERSDVGVLAGRRKSHLRLFVHHMNRLSRFLGLASTHFVNTHGLMNDRAYSCAQNVSLLAYHAMASPTFRLIVGTQSFRCRTFNRTFSHSKELQWQNTNKLLGTAGFVGVKTGVTPSAGPCLASCFEVGPGECFIVTVLKTKSCEMRFRETIALLRTALMHLLVSQADNSAYRAGVSALEGYSGDPRDEGELANNWREGSESGGEQEEEWGS